MLWSILIAAIPDRYHAAQPLLYSLLEKQSVARMPDVELIYLLDNKRRSVGAKRNALLDAARGEYISFIDDDDMVADDYVRKVHDAIIEARKADPRADVICFQQRATLHPRGITHECTYSLLYWKERAPEQRRALEATDVPGTMRWTGPPAHTMVWRRETVQAVRFAERNFGEDIEWVDAACAAARTERRIDGAPLYFYRFDEEGTATR